MEELKSKTCNKEENPFVAINSVKFYKEDIIKKPNGKKIDSLLSLALKQKPPPINWKGFF